MASMYAARLRNARRIGWILKKRLKEGYEIYNNENNLIEFVSFKGFFSNVGLRIDHIVYMDSDPEMANGMELTIKDFNKIFDGWKIIHPRDAKKLEI